MKTILVIEDEHEIRENIIDILSMTGFDVVGAENGRKGVIKALEIAPALIISDINMPELDGYGVLQELRAHELTSTTPFLFLTAKTEGADVRQGMNLGADDYLTKPFDIGDLINAVEIRLQKSAIIEERSKGQLDSLRQNIRKSFPHELLTPLTAIIGFSEFLLSEYEDIPPEEAKEMISDILFSGKRLHRTVNNLLFFAQLEVTDPVKQREEAGLSFETHAEFFLPDKIRQLSLLHERETDLLMEFSIGVIAVPPDYSAKIIEELVDNAFKYSQKGNPVVVKTTINNDKYIITIADKGRGMTLDQIKNIGAYMQFDRQFYEQQGSGLGLAIAKRCCELFSGVLTLTPNADGAGITAEVQLPLLSEQPMMEY